MPRNQTLSVKKKNFLKFFQLHWKVECIEGQRCGISIAPAPPAGKRGGFSIFNSKKYDFEIWRNTILQIGEIHALSRSDRAFALELSKVRCEAKKISKVTAKCWWVILECLVVAIGTCLIKGRGGFGWVKECIYSFCQGGIFSGGRNRRKHVGIRRPQTHSRQLVPRPVQLQYKHHCRKVHS